MDTHPTILVAEDDEDDVLFIKMAFKKTGLPNPLMIAHNGEEVVDYLKGNPPFNNRAVFPLPRLLLLDLKMPRMTGFEVLAWLAAHSEFEHLPAVVLSSSSLEADVDLSRQMGARDYFIKPNDNEQLTNLLLELSARWLSEVPQEA